MVVRSEAKSTAVNERDRTDAPHSAKKTRTQRTSRRKKQTIRPISDTQRHRLSQQQPQRDSTTGETSAEDAVYDDDSDTPPPMLSDSDTSEEDPMVTDDEDEPTRRTDTPRPRPILVPLPASVEDTSAAIKKRAALRLLAIIQVSPLSPNARAFVPSLQPPRPSAPAAPTTEPPCIPAVPPAAPDPV